MGPIAALNDEHSELASPQTVQTRCPPKESTGFQGGLLISTGKARNLQLRSWLSGSQCPGFTMFLAATGSDISTLVHCASEDSDVDFEN